MPAAAPMNLAKEFMDFLKKGNIIQLAVAFVMGTAFQAIVTSFVDNMMNPVIGLLGTGNLDNLFVAIKGDDGGANTPAAAQDNGAVTLNYGAVISSIITFVVISLFCFVVTKILIDSLKKEEAATKGTCEYCCEEISIEATRCPYCAVKMPLGTKKQMTERA